MNDNQISNKEIKIIFVIIFIIINVITVNGQWMSPSDSIRTPQSPNASALGKYGSIPISEHTGVPNISVPLTKLTEGNLSLPISLSYHSSGNKVSDVASWVGLGWSLNAGGVITRQIQGGPDEGGPSSDYTSTLGYYETNATSEVDSLHYFQQVGVGFWSAIATGRIDGQSDLYQFNFNGYSGTFFFGANRKILFKSHSDLKVHVEYDSTVTNPAGQMFSRFKYFIITTPDGTKYYFGGDESGPDIMALDRSYSRAYNGGGYIIPDVTAWHLVKITNAENTRSINFDYVPQEFSLMSPGVERASVMQNGGLLHTQRLQIGINTLSKHVEARLHQIRTSNKTIDFIANDLRADLGMSYVIFPMPSGYYFPDFTTDGLAKRLNEIHVKDKNGNCLRQFTLNMDYFTCQYVAPVDITTLSPATGPIQNANSPDAPSRKKLRLLSISEESCDNSVDPKLHSFSYYDPDFSQYSNAPRMPHRNSYAQDHWGYYNGKHSNSTFLSDCPKDYFNQAISNNWDDDVNETIQNYNWLADRSPSEEHTKAGILKEINYPTSGKTTFEYELNDFRNAFDTRVILSESTAVSCNANDCADCIANQIVEIPNITIQPPNNLNNRTITLEVKLSRVDQNNCNVANDDIQVEVGAIWQNTQGNGSIISLGTAVLGQSNNSTTKTFDILGTSVLNIMSQYKFVARKTRSGDPVRIEITYKIEEDGKVYENIPVGGLRIKKMIQNPVSSAGYEDNFEYNIGTSSSGKLLGFPQYFSPAPFGNLDPDVMEPQAAIQVGHSSGGALMNIRSYFSSGKGSMATTQGHHIGYTDVKVIKTNNGYVHNIYHLYSNPKTFYSKDFPLSPTWYNDYNDQTYLNGMLRESTIYNQKDEVIKKTSFTYDIETVGTSLNRLFSYYNAHQMGLAIITPSMIEGVTYHPRHYSGIARTYYNLKSMFIKQVEVTETIDGVDKTTYTSYHPDLLHTLPIETKSTNSDGTEMINRQRFVGDLTCPTSSCNSINEMQVIDDMISRNMIHLPLEQTSIIKKPGDTEKVLSSTLINYKNFGTNNNPIYKPEGQFLLRPNQPIQGFVPVNRNSNGDLSWDNIYESDMEYTFAFDDWGNQTLAQRKDDVQQLILWGYDHKMPIATVKNGHHKNIAYSDFNNGELGSWSFTGNLSSNGYGPGHAADLSTANISRTHLSPGKYLLSFWQKGPGTLVYVNGNQVHSFTGSSNAQYELKQTVITITGSGYLNSTLMIVGQGNVLVDYLRLHPSDAQMQSYMYDPLNLTLTGANNINNIPTFFEFDAFNRLIAVKDFESNLLSLHEYNFDSNALNQVKTYNARTSGLNENSILNAAEDDMAMTVSYVDGLGRPIQEIAVKSSPLKHDIIQFHEFNENNLELKKYLPFSFTSNNGNMHTNVKLKQRLALSSNYAITQIVNDSSPLNRPILTGQPGQNWQIGSGHESELTYRSNLTGEVRLFNSNGISSQSYTSGSLFVTIQKDENGNQTTTYQDRMGRLLMKENEGAKTVYVYDDFGRIKYVIPPNVFNQMEASGVYNCAHPNVFKGIYRYTYDQRGNIIRKLIPGRNNEMFYYDRLDRLVLTIDADGNKTALKYDKLSRPIISGLYSGNQIPNNANGLYETESNGTLGYTMQNSFPASNLDVNTVNYYDHYDFDRNGSIQSNENYKSDPQSEYLDEHLDYVHGALTGSKEAIYKPGTFEGSGFTHNTSFYDIRGNLIQTRFTNHTGEEEVIYSNYDFNGLNLKNKRMHRSNIDNVLQSLAVMVNYTYDHRGRLLRTYHQINSESPVLVSENKYNERDFLKAKELGVGNNSPLQRIDYNYNLRGWLTGINDIRSSCSNIIEHDISDENLSPSVGRMPNGLQDNSSQIKDFSNSQENDLFAMRLSYDKLMNGTDDGYHNGNIAQIAWQSGCGENIKLYDFAYDNRNQLRTADYMEGMQISNLINTGSYNMNADYDLSGNIIHLSRKANSVLIDDLSYTYDVKNHLTNLEETANLNEGFKSTQHNAGFTFDDRGNMNRDNHKLMNIEYNVQNLPILFAFDNQDSIKIQYSASGKKLAKYSKSNSDNTWSIKNYFGGIEYLDNEIEAVYFSEGRVILNNNSFQ
jgi:hypothetical protein